jgi:hypothetical protein
VPVDDIEKKNLPDEPKALHNDPEKKVRLEAHLAD